MKYTELEEIHCNSVTCFKEYVNICIKNKVK